MFTAPFSALCSSLLRSRRHCVVLAVGTSLGMGGVSHASTAGTAPALVSGSNRLTFPTDGNTGYGLLLQSLAGNVLPVSKTAPVTLFVCQGAALDPSSHTGTCPETGENSDPTANSTISVAYGSVVQTTAKKVTATATATSANGSSYRIIDVYTPAGTNMFTMSRTVSVVSAGSGSAVDTGFNSQFSLSFQASSEPVTNYHFLAPAILYDQNALAPSGAIASDLGNTDRNWFYWRETRSALPMLLMQDAATGSTLSLARTGPAADKALVVKSGAVETSQNWIVDPSVQYGSLGIQNVQQQGQANPQVSVGVIYPAEEGDVTYVGEGSPSGRNLWSRRSHPVVVGFSDSYAVTFDLESYTTPAAAADFHSAFSSTYRNFFNLLPPVIAPDHAQDVFKAGVELSKDLFTRQGDGNGDRYPGLPFQESVHGLDCTDNSPSPCVAYSYDMGFTGAQINLGFQLLRHGVRTNDAVAEKDGTAILNFWAKEDPAGMRERGSQLMPLTWFEPNHSPAVQWSNTSCAITGRPVFIRELADGMEAMIRAAVYARETPAVGAQKDWEDFVNLYGAWLLKKQDHSGTATNGSYERWYDPTSGEACPDATGNYIQSRNATTFPVRSLVDMYFVTGNTAFRDAARAAGAYAWTNIYGPMAFTGGILSNNQDRESGAQALHAALALYDLEYQQNPGSPATAQWLQAARIAADYLETWQYAYDIQVVDGTADHLFSADTYAGSRATSLSVLGSSTGDTYLSEESFDFFRLHLLADDPTNLYLHFARQLEYNTKLTTQLPSAGQDFGYAHNGFQTEAVTVADLYLTGTPVHWLTWLTGVQLDPQQQLQDTFGLQSIDKLLGDNPARLQEENHSLYPTPGSIGWGEQK